VNLPTRQPWSAAAVKLLQGVVYHDDGAHWDAILANTSPLMDYFGRIGIQLIVDEQDGMAWLRQPDAEELPREYESMPRLFRSVPLGFEPTLLCVVLRDELRRYEEEDFQNERCVVAQSDLLDVWQMFFPEESDLVRLDARLKTLLGKLEQLKFVRRFDNDPPSWEVRRILHARLTLEKLDTVKQALEAELARRKNGDGDNA
jgi:hypothetical protein